MKKKVLLFIIAILLLMNLFLTGHSRGPGLMEEIGVLRRAYPDALFDYTYDSEKEGWEIQIVRDGVSSRLYRAGGSYLREEQLKNKE